MKFTSIPCLITLILMASCTFKATNTQKKTSTLLANNTLKVLTYNVHACNPPSKKGVVDVEAIAKVIRDADPDVVALQEIDRYTKRSGKDLDQATEIGRLAGMHSYFVKAIDWSGGDYGIAILSKYPLLDTMSLRLPMADGIAGEARVVAIVKIQVHGKDLLFANTHLDIVTEHRELQAGAIVDYFSAQQLPVILAGDMNDVPGSKSLGLLQKLFQATCADMACEKTFPQLNPERTIDYILYNPGNTFKTLSHQVIAEEYASDHRPVLAVLQIL